MIRLQFSTTKRAGSAVIRWFTWSDFSHVEFVLDDGWLLGAEPDGGVQVRPPECARVGAVRFRVRAPRRVLDRALSQVGRPYDWLGVLGFGVRRDWAADDSWFCSEFVAWAFQAAGSPLLRAEHVHRLTPRDLLLSPRLVPA